MTLVVLRSSPSVSGTWLDTGNYKLRQPNDSRIIIQSSAGNSRRTRGHVSGATFLGGRPALFLHEVINQRTFQHNDPLLRFRPEAGVNQTRNVSLDSIFLIHFFKKSSFLFSLLTW